VLGDIRGANGRTTGTSVLCELGQILYGFVLGNESRLFDGQVRERHRLVFEVENKSLGLRSCHEHNVDSYLLILDPGFGSLHRTVSCLRTRCNKAIAQPRYQGII
jgi:hypothetical protein